jgi:hypothetical protein
LTQASPVEDGFSEEGSETEGTGLFGRGCCSFALALAGCALFVSAAQAAAPTLNSAGDSNRQITIDWTQGTSTTNSVEVSPTITTDSDGYFVDAVDVEDLASPGQFTTAIRFAPGSYYVHIGGCVDPCDFASAVEFSSPVLVSVGTSLWTPPVLTGLSQSGRRLQANWVNNSGYDMAGIEVAVTSGQTAADGFFLPDNYEFADGLDPSSVSYGSQIRFVPGLHYVHVVALDPDGVAPNGDACLLFSNVLSVNVPPDQQVGTGGGAATPPPVVTADKVTSFKALQCASTQKAKSLVVQASMAENGTITVGGTVSVPNASKVFKIKTVSVKAAAGKTVSVKVKLAKKALKAIKRALKRHKKIKAKLTITAMDTTGNTKAEKRSVKLK